MPVGAGVVVVLPEGVDRVADGPVVGPCQPVCEDLALEAAHVPRVKVLAEQVVGLDPVVVDQDDVGLPSLEEAAEALGDESARPAAADHGDPGVVQQERVVHVVGHFSFTSLFFDWLRFLGHQPEAGVRAVEDLRPLHRGEVAVDADPEAQLGPVVVEASGDAVDAKPLLVPVVGLREEGAGASVGVELGDHPCGRHIGQGRGRPNCGGTTSR